MSFLSPLFLIGALAAVVPIVLHMLKREPEARVRFAAVRLLKRAPVEQAHHRRIRELLLLALRVSALVLLALAFARPFVAAGESRSPGVTVVVVDTSLSMSAPGQFERARQMARDALSKAPSADLVGVVTFADAAEVAAVPARDRAAALAAIASAIPGHGATSYRAAMASASDMVNAYGSGRGSIVVVTDLQESGWDADDRVSVPDEARVEVRDVGAPPPNLAVTGIRRSDGRLSALLRNAGPATRDVRVQLTVDGRAAGEASASIGPNQLAEVSLPAARGLAAEVSIQDPEGIAGDNRRFLVLDDAARPAVAVVSATGDLRREAFYVQQALAASAPAGSSFEVEGTAPAVLSAWNQARVNGHAALVVLSTQGLDRNARERLAAYMRQGGGVLITGGDQIDPEVIANILGDRRLLTIAPAAAKPGQGTRRLAPADVRHPVFKAFGSRVAALGLVRFDRVAAIESSACPTLARFTGGDSAVVECEVGDGRALVLAFDLDRRGNDFPLQSSFVPFLHEAMRYLAAGGTAEEYVVGQGRAAQVPQPGIVTMEGANPARRAAAFAVNVNPAESDPRRIAVGDFEKTVVRLKDRDALQRPAVRPEEDRQSIWRYLLVLVMVALVTESFVARRTA